MTTAKYKVNSSWLRPRDENGRPHPKYYRRGDTVELDASDEQTRHLLASGALLSGDEEVEDTGDLYSVQPPTPAGYVVQAPVVTPGDTNTLAGVDHPERPLTTPSYPPLEEQTPSAAAGEKVTKQLRKDSTTKEAESPEKAAEARAEHEKQVQELSAELHTAAGTPTTKSTAKVLKDQQQKDNKANDKDNA